MKNSYEVRGDVTAIYLKFKGKTYETLIDTVDLPKAMSYPNTWAMHYQPDIDNYYVTGRVIEGGIARHYKLHRVIMDTPDGMVVDHINHKTLDNRKSNLRNITDDQNKQNRFVRNDRRGVKWHKGLKKWTVTVTVSKKTYSFGTYDSYEEALEISRQARAKFQPYSLEALQDIVSDTIKPSVREKSKKQSGVPGVTWHEKSGKWRVRVKIDGRMTIIGSYTDLERSIQRLVDHKNCSAPAV